MHDILADLVRQQPVALRRALLPLQRIVRVSLSHLRSDTKKHIVKTNSAPQRQCLPTPSSMCCAICPASLVRSRGGHTACRLSNSTGGVAANERCLAQSGLVGNATMAFVRVCMQQRVDALLALVDDKR